MTHVLNISKEIQKKNETNSWGTGLLNPKNKLQIDRVGKSRQEINKQRQNLVLNSQTNKRRNLFTPKMIKLYKM